MLSSMDRRVKAALVALRSMTLLRSALESERTQAQVTWARGRTEGPGLLWGYLVWGCRGCH